MFAPAVSQVLIQSPHFRWFATDSFLFFGVFAKLATLVETAQNAVVLTGAGISAESGVPTFRGAEGLWGKFKAEELATMEAFMANPKIVWEWYNWRRELLTNVEPNNGHKALCALESWFNSFTLITQNVDGLHAKAGSEGVLELHGNIERNKCAGCNRPFESKVDIDPDNAPRCDHCGGKVRPDVVWFGEMLPEETIDTAFIRSRQADIFFCVGTSALVHPAASLPVTAKSSGASLIEINPEPTPISAIADICLHDKAGRVLPQIVDYLKEHSAA